MAVFSSASDRLRRLLGVAELLLPSFNCHALGSRSDVFMLSSEAVPDGTFYDMAPVIAISECFILDLALLQQSSHEPSGSLQAGTTHLYACESQETSARTWLFLIFSDLFAAYHA